MMARVATERGKIEELLLIWRCGQAAGGHGGWLEQESAGHVNELSSTYFSLQPVKKKKKDS